MQNRVLDRVLSLFQEEELLALLKKMIAIPSHKQVPWQEDRMAQFIYDTLQQAGIEELHLDYIQENRPNIMARIPGSGGGKSLLLNGHLDTIPPYHMAIPPHQPHVKDGYLYGLGAVDMKGSLSAMILAMILIKRAGIQLKGDCWFTGVIDQEQCSLGTVELVRQGFQADYAVVGEPTDLKICVAHKGMEWMKVMVRGHSTHGSTPEKGANAIYHGCRIARELEKFNASLQEKHHPLVGSPSINLGVITGGDDPNIVPRVCFLELDRRWTPEESRENLYMEISRILNRLKLAYPEYHCEIIPMDDRVCSLGNIPLEVEEDIPLVQSLQQCIAHLSPYEAVVTSFRAWSDAALLHRELGIPAVVFGPGKPERAHAADEGIEVSTLIAAARIYTGLILDICGVAHED